MGPIIEKLECFYALKVLALNSFFIHTGDGAACVATANLHYTGWLAGCYKQPEQPAIPSEPQSPSPMTFLLVLVCKNEKLKVFLKCGYGDMIGPKKSNKSSSSSIFIYIDITTSQQPHRDEATHYSHPVKPTCRPQRDTV